MRKPNLYLVLDTETATLPFANEVARNTEEKKNIAIAKPIVYNIAWQIIDKRGNVYAQRSFLIQETFFVPAIFNTAYYASKRPFYIEALERGEIAVAMWNDVMKILREDMETVKFVCAYNAMFDFKKAIPFTELYISKLYSADYTRWEIAQRHQCYCIAQGEKGDSNPNFDKENFHFRGTDFPMLDLWGLSCYHLLNNGGYKTDCLRLKMLSPSGLYFKSSAEATYRYLEKKFEFEESHTALEDVILECEILRSIFSRKKKMQSGITYFPFRELGNTVDFACRNQKRLPLESLENLCQAIANRMQDEAKPTGERFYRQLENALMAVENILVRRAEVMDL